MTVGSEAAQCRSGRVLWDGFCADGLCTDYGIDSPCLNEGKCWGFVSESNWKDTPITICECTSNWEGDTCDKVSVCGAGVCKNNGKCSLELDGEQWVPLRLRRHWLLWAEL
jgi:hypothetical protein